MSDPYLFSLTRTLGLYRRLFHGHVVQIGTLGVIMATNVREVSWWPETILQAALCATKKLSSLVLHVVYVECAGSNFGAG